MRKLSKKTIWILVGVLFLLAILLIILCTFAEGNWPKVLMVLLAIDFIALTILVQWASFQTFRFKAKPINYPTKDYIGSFEALEGNLKNTGFKERKEAYGKSYLKIEGAIAYKCSLILDVEKYFNPEEQPASQPNKDLEKCSKFIGLEIFHHIDEANLAKLPDFSIQGNNLFYTALLYQENDLFKCLNYVEPNGGFKEGFNKLIEGLALKEYIEEKEEN